MTSENLASFPEVSSVRYLDDLLSIYPNTEEFVITNSAWMALLGVRPNNDLDLLTTVEFRARIKDQDTENSFGLEPNKRKIRAHGRASYFARFCTGPLFNDIVSRYSVLVGGVRFIQPRLYIEYKISRVLGNPYWLRLVAALSRKGNLVDRIAIKILGRRYRKLAKDYHDLVQIKKIFENSYHVELFPSIGAELWGEESVREFAPLKLKS